MNMLKSVMAVFLKDLRIELHSRYAINTVLAFVAGALLLILFALRAEQLPPEAQSGIVWIVILFAALSSLSRSFVSETEQQTFNLLRLHGSSGQIFGGKLLYNFIFTFVVNMIIFVLYIFLLDLGVASSIALLAILFFGTAGLCGVSTLLAAIVSQADRKGAIFSVLGIPLMFPLILILVDATKIAIFENFNSAFINNLLAMIGFTGAVITAGFLLFEYLWNE